MLSPLLLALGLAVIAPQAPEPAWLVTTDDHGDVVRFGYVYRHGTTSEMPIGTALAGAGTAEANGEDFVRAG